MFVYQRECVFFISFSLKVNLVSTGIWITSLNGLPLIVRSIQIMDEYIAP